MTLVKALPNLLAVLLVPSVVWAEPVPYGSTHWVGGEEDVDAELLLSDRGVGLGEPVAEERRAPDAPDLTTVEHTLAFVAGAFERVGAFDVGAELREDSDFVEGRLVSSSCAAGPFVTWHIGRWRLGALLMLPLHDLHPQDPPRELPFSTDEPVRPLRLLLAAEF